MGNEEGQANTEKGVQILTAMKALADELDGSRPVSIAPTGAIGTRAAWWSATWRATTTWTRRREEFHKKHPEQAGDGHGDGERGGHARHLHHRRVEGIRGFLRSVHDDGARIGRGLVELLQRAAVALGRIRVDGLRLSRRALAERVAEHQLAVRHHRHLRISEGLVLLLPIVVDE